nr:hypothetical protein [Tanacetum cinerariifolium]
MLRKKIEEIETYNSSIHRPFIKTYRCFHCNERGHYMRNCCIKKKALLDAKRMAGVSKAVAEKEASKPVNINPNLYPTPTVSLDYHESIHLKTKCMIKGTDLDHWDNIWVPHQDTCPIRGIPTQDVEEDDGHLRSPQNGFEEKIAPNIQTTDKKNKGKLEHFGITLEGKSKHPNGLST